MFARQPFKFWLVVWAIWSGIGFASTASAKTISIRLVSPTGKKIPLAAIAPSKPVVLIVLKGTWCPTCMDQLTILRSKAKAMAKSGGRMVALVHEGDGNTRIKLNQQDESIPVYGASQTILQHLEFWNGHLEHPIPGLIFLNKCGQLSFFLLGRSPETDQSLMIFNALDFLAHEPSQCGMLI